MTVLHRFTKPGGHWAEIRERKITQYQALEFLVYVDGSLLESRLFHGARAAEYPGELAQKVEQYTSDGWSEEAVAKPTVS